MRRIMMMVLRLFLKAPYYFYCISRCAKRADISYEESFECIKKVTKAANRAGKVKIESYGLENIPKENGFIFFPNHQGLFDVLVFLDSCPVPFSFVIKKEIKDVILLKQVIAALDAIVIDREDIRQSMQVINRMAAEVKKGKNFVIFPEGTRSKMGNHTLPFKGGTFKSAVKAKCPIVPCALIDCFKPFDEKSIAPVTVKVFYLKPLLYEEYASMKTPEIAAEVRRRIEETIEEYERTGKGFLSESGV